MKRFWPIAIGMLLVMFSVGLFSASRVSAATGCFLDTNGHWAENFVCWLNSNGIAGGYPGGTFRPENNVTRAEIAVMLQRMRSTGVIQINAGSSSWHNHGGSSGAYVLYFRNGVSFRTNTIGEKVFVVAPDIPSSLYNSLLYFTSAQICYDTSFNNAYITKIEVQQFNNDGLIFQEIVDDTDRINEAACRKYKFPSPGRLYGTDVVSLSVTVNFSNITDETFVTSATFYLTPSADPAVP